jgi:hypothetical protein
MLPLFFLALSLQNPQPTAAPAPANTAAATLKPLSFASKRFPYRWNATLSLNMDVDGLKVTTIFFNRREIKGGLLKGADFGTRCQLEVTNGSNHPKVPGFAVAVFDAEDRLLGVSSGGTRVGTVKPGDTETFDLNFRFLSERLPLGSYFILSVELSD